MNVEQAVFSEEFVREARLEGVELQQRLAEAILERNEQEMQEREPLGEGKAAHVWKTEAEFFGKEACVKTIHNQEISLNDLVREFRLHQKFLRAGVHVPRPIGVVQGSGTTEAQYGLLAMELVRGQNLEQWIQGMVDRKESISNEQYLLLRKAIKKQIQLAHDAHLYHRDLHPRNLMLGEKGLVDENSVWMIDFGDATEVLGGADEAEIYQSEVLRNGVPDVQAYPRDEQILTDLADALYAKGLIRAEAA